MAKTSRTKTTWREVWSQEITSAPTFAELLESLTTSSLYTPKPVVFIVDEEGCEPVELQVAITHLKSDFAVPIVPEEERGVVEQAIGPNLHPDVKFKGWVLRSGYNPRDVIVRVKGVYRAMTGGSQEGEVTLWVSAPIERVRFLASLPNHSVIGHDPKASNPAATAE